MPQPWTYRHASKEYRAFLDDAKERMNLSSDNMTYTAVEGVFHVFRRRLTVQQALDFANILPCVPRAIFVANWKLQDTPCSFQDRATLAEEVRQHRVNHNLTPPNAIEATAYAVRRSILPIDFERVLVKLPDGCREFWHVDTNSPDELKPRII